ncbi:hypothetical protein D3C87_1888540 [compost metagenome]
MLPDSIDYQDILRSFGNEIRAIRVQALSKLQGPAVPARNCVFEFQKARDITRQLISGDEASYASAEFGLGEDG